MFNYSLINFSFKICCLLQQLFILHISIIFKLRFIVTVEIYLRSLFKFYQKVFLSLPIKRVDLFPACSVWKVILYPEWILRMTSNTGYIQILPSWKGSLRGGGLPLGGSFFPFIRIFQPWWENLAKEVFLINS